MNKADYRRFVADLIRRDKDEERSKRVSRIIFDGHRISKGS